MNKLAVLCVAVCLALILSVSLLHGAKTVNNQYATVDPDAPELGPTTHVCITAFDAKPRYKCGDLQIGMDEATVAARMGNTEHGTTTNTTAGGKFEYWQYVGFNEEKDVTLLFVNGRLDAVQQ